jgi:hypothetical protein
MRTEVYGYDHFVGVLTALSSITQFDIGEGEAPKNTDGTIVDPPYAVLYLLAGGDMDGPISDSQADVVMRFQITAVGKSEKEALAVQDYCTKRMQKAYVTVSGRKVRNLTKVLASNGVIRDDDVATPVFYCFQQWDLNTTPS